MYGVVGVVEYTKLRSGVTRALIGGGGGGVVYSYIRVLPDGFLLKLSSFKRNPSGRTRIYEYTPPPPQPLKLRLAALGKHQASRAVARALTALQTSYEINTG